MSTLLSIIVAALWALAVIRILLPVPHFTPIMAVLLVGFVLVVLLRLPRHTKILCGGLAAVTALLAWRYAQWPAIQDGIAKSVIYPAFLATIVLLRAAADQRPEIAAARKLFGTLDPAKRDSGIVIGTHLMAAILQVGAFAILAPILGRDASAEERRDVFTVSIRGMATVPYWSPFIVGMAVAAQYLPMVPLWQIMSMGLSLGVLSLAVSVLFFDRNPSLDGLRRALGSLLPVALPVFVAALIVVGTTATTGLSTLQALILSLPIPCVLAIVSVRGASLRTAIRQTTSGIGRVGPETSILVFSTVLGAVFEAALPEMGLLAWMKAIDLPAAAIIFAVIVTMIVTGLFGIHVIVTGSFLLVIFTSIPTGLSDLVLMQAILVGWGLASVVSISSLSVATGAAMFRLPATDLVTRRNIAYVAVNAALVGAILAGLNALLA